MHKSKRSLAEMPETDEIAMLVEELGDLAIVSGDALAMLQESFAGIVDSLNRDRQVRDFKYPTKRDAKRILRAARKAKSAEHSVGSADNLDLWLQKQSEINAAEYQIQISRQGPRPDLKLDAAFELLFYDWQLLKGKPPVFYEPMSGAVGAGECTTLFVQRAFALVFPRDETLEEKEKVFRDWSVRLRSWGVSVDPKEGRASALSFLKG